MNLPEIAKDRLGTLEDALKLVSSDQTVVTAMAAAEPALFFESLATHAKDKKNLLVYCANPGKEYSCFSDPELVGRLNLAVLFLTARVRHLQGREVVHYIPQHLSHWVKNILHRGEVDVFWGSCTPPDERGFVSLGPSCCYEPEILRSAKKVVLEINHNLPQTFGETHIPASWVDCFVESDHPLPTIPSVEPTENDFAIARHVCELIEDGSTLQLGIGGIPNAVGELLKDKKDLGIHTEMINDAMMKLFQSGVVTGRHKTIWPGQMVGAFALGSEALYEFLDGNPLVEFQPASVVNDPNRIARNHRMISINTAVEVDITGQVCSESIGHRELSGVGGASETHIGAQLSEGGRGIIAIPSVTGKGQSKIVFELQPGAKVSISRNDIDTVVTEFGVAELRGRSVAERVRALAAISHPDFREDLLAKAHDHHYI